MKKIHRLVKVIVFLIIFIMLFQIACFVTKRKDDYMKNADFFYQKEEFDILFLGNSHIRCGVMPMELYDEYGFISYNLGSSGLYLVSSYYNILFALENTNKPKLIVLDTYLVEKKAKYKVENVNQARAQIHQYLDIYPNSYNKIVAIKDLFDNDKILENEIEYLVPFSKYHSRWSTLTKQDFKMGNTYEKGATSSIQVANPGGLQDYAKIEPYSGEETINMIYLRKIIELCKEKDIDILVTFIPFPANEENIAGAKYVGNICKDYNVNYINFLEVDGVINYDTDLYDVNEVTANSHLNPSGARKVTKYLGKYIQEHYDIRDHREDERYNFWKNDYNEYIDFKISNLKKYSKNINSLLMLLYDEKDIKYEIVVSSNYVQTKNNIVTKLLENIDNNYIVDDSIFNDDKKDKNVKITLWDSRNNKEIQTVWF